MPKLSLILPCYFNEKNIPVTMQVLLEVEKKFDPDVEVEFLLIDDGSRDKTYEAIEKFQAQFPEKVTAIKLTRNFGSSNAVLAGLQYGSGDCFAFLAADLQDSPEHLLEMVKYWKNGFKLVIANRQDREDPTLQKWISSTYHYFMTRFGVSRAPRGGFDLMLFDREIRDKVLEINEANTFLPYLITWLGYPYVNVPSIRRKREIGKSSWSFSKKVKSFIDSFVAFSYFPIRMISVSGLVIGGIALIYMVMIVYEKFRSGISVSGWASLMVAVLFLASFQIIALGIMGEYIWRILDSSRRRPNFIIEKVVQSQIGQSGNAG